MDDVKANRLNELFEKMVSEHASRAEQVELKHLYTEFIENGRESVRFCSNEYSNHQARVS